MSRRFYWSVGVELAVMAVLIVVASFLPGVAS